MAATQLIKIEVPMGSGYDMDLLQRQLTEFARTLIATSRPAQKSKDAAEAKDPFSCFSGDWGGAGSAHEIAERLRHDRHFDRNMETW